MTKNNEVYGLTGGTMVNDAGINENKETIVAGILEEVREQAGKLAERIQEMIEGRDQFEYADLKLHDVASFVGEDTDDLFTQFCTEQLQVWEDRMADSDLSTRYIGRSSSFYITPDTSNEAEALAPFYSEWQFERDAEDVIIEVNEGLVGYGTEEVDVISGMIDAIQRSEGYGIDEFMEPYASIYGNKDEFTEEAEELAYYALDFIDELNQALDYVEERLDVVENAYKWLEDYKADQVEVYREWLASYEEVTQ